MKYLIQIMRLDLTVVHVETSVEHPNEDYLRALVAKTGGDFADICRFEGVLA